MSRTVKRTTPTRPYNATRRREQAEQTRMRILDTARDLFVDRGYGRTTVADIARDAGVAAETVYAAFRNKPTLLHHVWYTTFRGDDANVRLLHRPEIQAVLAEPDLATRLRLHVRTMVPVMRRFTPLLRAIEAAAANEPARALCARCARRSRRCRSPHAAVLSARSRTRRRRLLHTKSAAPAWWDSAPRPAPVL